MLQTQFGDNRFERRFEERLQELTDRVSWLENALNKKEIEPETEPEPELLDAVKPVEMEQTRQNEPEPEPEPQPESIQICTPQPAQNLVVKGTPSFLKEIITEETQSDEKQDNSKDTESFETRIGLYWLNRLGIVSLVIGVALFILYSYPTWGPWLKLGVGVLTSIAMIVGGEIFEKSKEHSTQSLANRFWGRGLMGGGWALLYFTAYAAYHIPDVAVLSNLFMEELILTGICLSALRHASSKNSQIIAAMAVLLSFVTISFSDIEIGTAYWIMALAVRAMLVCQSMQWYPLLMLTTIFGYTTYYFVVEPKLPMPQGDAIQNLATLVAFTIFWLACNRAVVQMRSENPVKGAQLTITTVINGLCHVFIASNALWCLQNHLKFQLDYLAPLCAGLFYFCSYPLKNKSDFFSLASLRLVMGMCFITGSIYMFTPLEAWQSNFWLLEIVALLYLGIKYKIELMRYFAYALSALVSFQKLNLIQTGVGLDTILQSVYTACIFGICWYLCKKYKNDLSPVGRTYFFVLSQVFIWFVPVNCAQYFFPEAGKNQLVAQLAGWILQYSALFLISIKSKDVFWKFATIYGFTCFAIQSAQITNDLLVTCSVVAVFLAAALITHLKKDSPNQILPTLCYGYIITGAALLCAYHTTFYFDQNVQAFALSWVGEAAVLTGIGFRLKDPATRQLGFFWHAIAAGAMLIHCASWNAGTVTLIIAIFYILAQIYRKQSSTFYAIGETGTANLYEAAANLLTTVTIWNVFPGKWTTVFLCTQALTLFFIGYKAPDKPFRLAAIAVFVLFGINSLTLKAEPLVSCFVVLSFLIAAIATHFKSKITGLDEAARNYKLYITGATMLCWFHTLNLADDSAHLLALNWATEASLLVAIGYWLKSKFTRHLGSLWFLSIFCQMLFRFGYWNALEVTLVIVIFYLLAQTYRRATIKYVSEEERIAAHLFEGAGTFLATMAIWDLVPSEWLTACLSAEGLALLVVGFLMPDKPFRLSGLAVFMLLGVKLLFIDLGSARTDARILSFILAGIILLLASYIYTKWVPRLLLDRKDGSSKSSTVNG